MGDDEKTDLYQHFDTISQVIGEEGELGRVVLAHCVAGVSRSATLCLAYLRGGMGACVDHQALGEA